VRLDIEISGDLDRLMASEIRAGARAVKGGVAQAAGELKANWRAQIVSAGLGAGLSKTVRSEVYPPGRPSMNAAAMVYTKSPKIIAAHETGATIRARDGIWLAIPTPAAGKARGGKRLTPGEWQFQSGKLLRFVPTGPGRAVLVADGVRTRRSTGKAVPDRRRNLKRQTTPVPIFILVRQVKLPKRLNLIAAGVAAQARLPGLISGLWDHA